MISEFFASLEAWVSDAYSDIQRALTTFHEIAHSWFPEIVTPPWNTDAFLVESIVYYLEIKGVNHQYPYWNAIMHWFEFTYYAALYVDDDMTQRPIVQVIPSNSKDKVASQDIVNNKGPAVLRMMECFMGEENMRRGFNNYLTTFAYKAARPRDLWLMMQPYSSGINITKVMTTWTEQNSYPLLTVTRNDNQLIVTQSRFLFNKSATYNRSDSEFGYVWEIPITFIASNGYKVENPLWLGLDKPKLTIDLPSGLTWVKLNNLQCGFYRVNYSLEDWNMLASLLVYNVTALDPIDRAGILDDAFILAQADYIPYEIPLNLTKYMDKENNYIPWYLVLYQHVYVIEPILKCTPGYTPLREYFSSKLLPHMDKSIWNFSPYNSIAKRRYQRLMVNYACYFGVKPCLITAKRMFDDWLLHCGRIPPKDIRQYVYNYAISVSGQYEWNELWKRFLNESNEEERGILREALCYTQESRIISQLLEMAHQEDQVYFLEACVNNPVALPIVWDYLRKNWNVIAAKFQEDFAAVIITITTKFCTDIELKEVKMFLNEIPEEVVTEADRQYIFETIQETMALKEKYADYLSKWFLNAVQ